MQIIIDGIVYDNTPVEGCDGCNTPNGRWVCKKHGINSDKEHRWSLYEGREESGEEYFIR